MSTTTKSGGGCKKCKRGCPKNASKNNRNQGGFTFTMGPLVWVTGYGPGEPVADKPFVDVNKLIKDVDALLEYMKLTGCLKDAGTSELQEVKLEMLHALGTKLVELEDSGALTPPPAGQCQYLELSNISITFETKNCTSPSGKPLPPDVDAEIKFDTKVFTKPCP